MKRTNDGFAFVTMAEYNINIIKNYLISKANSNKDIDDDALRLIRDLSVKAKIIKQTILTNDILRKNIAENRLRGIDETDIGADEI